MASTAYIVECKRSASGKRNGVFSHLHPLDLAAPVLRAVTANIKNKALIDDVIFGCVSQVGAQGMNMGRMAVLAAGLPESVPGTTVDRQCGSSMQALQFACQAVMSGTQDIVIAAGVEAMSQVPIGSSVTDGIAAGHGHPQEADGLRERYGDVMFSQFDGAEMVAETFGVSREEMDTLALESHRRAFEASERGDFATEIVPIKGFDKKNDVEVVVTRDEGIRWPANEKKIRALKPLREGGRLTAASASQINDQASAVLVCNEAGLRKLGLRPRAKIIGMAVAGSDPVMMLSGPIPATKKVLAQTGLSIDQFAFYEVNEAFASVPLAWQKELGADLQKLNPWGSGMSIGHALGSTGTRMATTMVNLLERHNGRYGLLAICEGGGTANALVIERIPASRL